MATSETTSHRPDRQVHLRTCPLCEAMCGLEIHVGTGSDGEHDGGDQPQRSQAGTQRRVELIRPDRADVWSKGYICPRGRRSGTSTTTPTG